MKITHVRVRKVDNSESNVKAIAEVRLDDCFVIKEIRIRQKPDKMVVAMPSRMITVVDHENGDETKKIHKDLAHPINQETREMFNDAILGVYERAPEDEEVYEEDLD